MEKIYRVFVSSTYEDLREERAEVQKSLLKFGCLPVGMELFPSTDEETWEFIKRQISDSDYYVLVIGGRYGSVGPDGIGYTEMEYDFAKSIGKPALAFVHGERGKIEADKTELDSEKRTKLEAFIKKVRTGPLVQTYTSPHELAGQVLVGMVELRDRRPAVGFVRGDQAADPKKYADLMEEVARLRAEIDESKSGNLKFSGHEDCIAITIEELHSVEHNGTRTTAVASTTEVSISKGDLFAIISDKLIDTKQLDEWLLSKEIATRSAAGASNNLRLSDDSLTMIRRTMYSYRLIDISKNDFITTTWSLTDYGRGQSRLFLYL